MRRSVPLSLVLTFGTKDRSATLACSSFQSTERPFPRQASKNGIYLLHVFCSGGVVWVIREPINGKKCGRDCFASKENRCTLILALTSHIASWKSFMSHSVPMETTCALSDVLMTR